ncbi:hypothetical protein BpHYR1_035744 [Brachionus plicatilis]|uniref:Uncharacterized protein n=1 Tax=Brachionus plicatilis TaxID=10195 RepID=A0A3M7SSF8_BRAPC|nr:hypothetical protein BpHYR1_035744 [Brachionus plicatilis]
MANLYSLDNPRKLNKPYGCNGIDFLQSFLSVLQPNKVKQKNFNKNLGFRTRTTEKKLSPKYLAFHMLILRQIEQLLDMSCQTKYFTWKIKIISV